MHTPSFAGAESEKARTPSWTDRVLYRGDLLRQHTYMAHHTILFSDHVPVSALFSYGKGADKVVLAESPPKVPPRCGELRVSRAWAS